MGEFPCSRPVRAFQMPWFAAAIILGAFLLFQVQPLIGKYILPWFGGGPGVWTACLLFFQLALLAGYFYAHLLSSRVRPKTQMALHCSMLAFALLLLPIVPGEFWKPGGAPNPTFAILGLLSATVGLPYMLLAATGPLLQTWMAKLRPGAGVYRLYALSNAASMFALVSYPIYFETHLARQAQARLWSGGFMVYALFCGWSAYLAWRGRALEQSENAGSAQDCSQAPCRWCKTMWVLLAGCGTILLIATTNKLCQDVAVVPFLWVVPLALYLASFIVAFDSSRWYARLPFTLLLCASLAALCWVMRQGTNMTLAKQIAIYSGALFVCCMICHGELFRLRPATPWLTQFYLAIAGGGALGGIFVAVVAPVIFQTYLELPIGMLLCATLFIAACAFPGLASQQSPETVRTWIWLSALLAIAALGALDVWLHTLTKGLHGRAQAAVWVTRIVLWITIAVAGSIWVFGKKYRHVRNWRLIAGLWMSAGWVVLGGVLGRQMNYRDPGMVYRSRSFYGVLTVYENQREDPWAHHVVLQHGGITHGLQLLGSDQKTLPTSYYSEESGVGTAFRAMPQSARRIGLVGLGAGTLAAYGQKGDYLRIYEINPEVERIARSYFTYLSDCPAQIEMVLGDARLSMEREASQQFDILVLDAFSSDAIPVHLLTREAFQSYVRHLRKGGVIAIHISNHYLDLEPVVRALAREFRLHDVLVDSEEQDDEWWNYTSSWMLLTGNKEILASAAIRSALRDVEPAKPGNSCKEVLWTDDFSNLYDILR